MKYDPFTLTVALDKTGNARGELYLDDGVSYDHESGAFVWREFTAGTKGRTLRIASADLARAKPAEAVDHVALATYDAANAFAQDIAGVRVEKLLVLGIASEPTAVTLASGTPLEWEFHPGVAAGASKEGETAHLVIKNPVASIASDWEVVIKL